MLFQQWHSTNGSQLASMSRVLPAAQPLAWRLGCCCRAPESLPMPPQATQIGSPDKRLSIARSYLELLGKVTTT